MPTIGQDTVESEDNAGAVIRPPIALLIAIVVGVGLNWLHPLPFVPARLPAVWIGTLGFVVALAFGIWAIRTIVRAGTGLQTSQPTTTIVSHGPYRFTRNPIYVGMIAGLLSLAIAFDSLWLVAAAVVFFVVIRYGVVAREEAYLERKFGQAYLDYKSRVRRWL